MLSPRILFTFSDGSTSGQHFFSRTIGDVFLEIQAMQEFDALVEWHMFY